MSRHTLKFQVTIPAHLTRTPQQAMNKVINGAVQHLSSLVPGATNKDFRPVYEERITKLGTVWDLLVVMRFDYAGPLPPEVSKLKLHHDISMQLRRNQGN